VPNHHGIFGYAIPLAEYLPGESIALKMIGVHPHSKVGLNRNPSPNILFDRFGYIGRNGHYPILPTKTDLVEETGDAVIAFLFVVLAVNDRDAGDAMDDAAGESRPRKMTVDQLHFVFLQYRINLGTCNINATLFLAGKLVTLPPAS